MEKDYSEAINKLVRQYYDHEIIADDYRTSRRRLIDQMDLEFNGHEFNGRNGVTEILQNQT